jgi:hypothetical protein
LEVFTGKKADLSKVRAFGCYAYPKLNDRKIDVRSQRHVFLGLDEQAGFGAYRLGIIEHGRLIKVMTSRDVTFDERHIVLKHAAVGDNAMDEDNDMDVQFRGSTSDDEQERESAPAVAADNKEAAHEPDIPVDDAESDSTADAYDIWL